MTNVRLKEVATKATNKDFYNQFATASSVTAVIGYFGQFISALTEFHFVFSAAGGTYKFDYSIKNLLAFGGGLSAIYIFEVLGVRVFLVRIIRQIVNKDFQGSERKTLFSFNLLFVLVLCGTNLLTSWLGQKYSFASVTNVTTTDKTHQLEIEKNAKIDKLTARYDVKLEQLKTDYQTNNNNLTAQYETDIKELKNSRWTHRENKNKYDSYTVKIDNKLASKTTDLNDLKNQFDNSKHDIDLLLTKQITNTVLAYDNRINDISKTEKSNINMLVLVQKYTLPILIFFILLSWFAIVYREIFLKGSGQQIEVLEVEKRPILLVEFLTGLYDKIYQMFYYLTARFLGSKKYEFKAIKQDVKTYQLTKLETQKIAAQTFRKIGFNYNGSDNQNNQNGNPTNIIEQTSQSYGNTNIENYNDSPLNVDRYTDDLSNLKPVINVKVKPCKNCQKTFSFKHWNAQYCSDKCRIENWEKRTGTTFKKKSKKH